MIPHEAWATYRLTSAAAMAVRSEFAKMLVAGEVGPETMAIYNKVLKPIEDAERLMESEMALSVEVKP